MYKHKKRQKTDNLLDFPMFVSYLVRTINEEFEMDKEKTEVLVKMLEEQKKDLFDKIASIDTTIEIMKQSQLLDAATQQAKEPAQAKEFKMDLSDGYDSKMSMNNKIRFFLKKENKFLHNKQIKELIIERENHLDLKKLSGQLSTKLSNLKRDGVIDSVQIGKSRRNTFWGSKHWIDANGLIKPGYEYDEKYLYDAVHEDIEI